MKPDASLSIVSHGQGHLIKYLLQDIARGIDISYELIITLNIPEDETFLFAFQDLPIKIIRNSVKKGFGKNHNAAFSIASGRYFIVVNPDMRIPSGQGLSPLLGAFKDEHCGACAPRLHNKSGSVEDNARKFPTFWELFKRKFLGIRKRDYQFGLHPISVDWVAGMFVVFRRNTYDALGGFDERYFMYFEDADICRRVRGMGLNVQVVPSVILVHDAQRASERSFRHLMWHLRSACRFLFF